MICCENIVKMLWTYHPSLHLDFLNFLTSSTTILYLDFLTFHYVFIIAYFIEDNVIWWCRKNHQWAIQSSHTRNNICTIKREYLIESTDVVPAKYPQKVKLEFLTTLECLSWGELCVPVFWGFLGFYSSVEPNSYACTTNLFLIGKIFINMHILLVLEFYSYWDSMD